MSILYLDTEGSNLLPMCDTIWVCCTKMEDDERSFRNPEDFKQYILEVKPDTIVIHNKAYDLESLRKNWGCEYTVGKQDSFLGLSVQFVCTWVLSQMLNADRPGGHSLATFGEQLGFEKGEHSDWSQWSQEMQDYCVRDVQLLERAYALLLREVEAYGHDDFFGSQFWTAAKISSHRMSLQGTTGIGFDREGANQLLASINVMMEKIEQEIEPQLPERPLNKGETDSWRLPARPFLKSGEWSSAMLKWMERTGAERIDNNTIRLQGNEYAVIGGQPTITTGPMKLANQGDLKEWLERQGWVPTFHNFQRDARGKPARDERGRIILTTSKLQENGRLCPNLEEMAGELVRPVVKWLSLRNRRAVVEGWLSNPRLNFDGRLSAGFSGFTNTGRKRHSEIVNLPKAEPSVTLGKEIRSLFIPSKPGYKLVGCDVAGLEARVEAHYTYTMKGGVEYAKELLEGDIHTKTAGVVFYEQLKHIYGTEDFHKDHPDVKPYRHMAKTLKYASSYGASPAKIAKTLGRPESEAEQIYQGFWDAAQPLALLKEKLELHWQTVGDGKRIRGIDGRWIATRNKHSLVNALFQGAGAIIVDYAGMFYDKKMGGITVDNDNRPCYYYKGEYIYRVAEMHDEWLDEAPEHLAGEIGEIRRWSIRQAGRFLKLKVELDGDANVGTSWASVH